MGHGALAEYRVEEKPNSAINKAQEIVESFNNGLSVNNLALAERYLKGELWVVLHLRRMGVKYRAYFQRELSIGWSDKNPRCFNAICEPAFEYGRKNVGDSFVAGPYWNDQSVFIEIGEPLEFPKTVVPSLVWLERSEDRDALGAGGGYICVDGSFKILGGFADREASLSGDLAAAFYHQRASEEVEGRPKVVDCITNDGGPFFRNGVELRELMNDLSGFMIVLSSDSYGLGSVIGGNSGIEVIDVMFGPAYLKFWAAQRICTHG